jgi:hypothetical protein
MISANEQQIIIVVSIVLIQALSYHAWSENDRLSSWSRSSHLIDEIKIMLARYVSNVNWSSTDTTSCGVEARIIMNCLKHVPIWDQIQVLSKQSVVCVDKDVPWVTGGYLREEII